jgi:hypothetical protein
MVCGSHSIGACVGDQDTYTVTGNQTLVVQHTTSHFSMSSNVAELIRLLIAMWKENYSENGLQRHETLCRYKQVLF